MDFPIALPDMAANLTDWDNGHFGAVPPLHDNFDAMKHRLKDFRDGVQTDPHDFPIRIGEWKTVSVSYPFSIDSQQFIALGVTESEEVCGRYTGCDLTYSELAVITRYNQTSGKFELHQRLPRDASPIAFQSMRIVSDYYLVIANGEGDVSGYPLQQSGGGVNLYFWNMTTEQFYLRQTLKAELPQGKKYKMTPRDLEYFHVDDPVDIHFLAIAFHSEQDAQGASIMDTLSFIYSWVDEGFTVMPDGSVDSALGFQVFQVLRTNGATSLTYMEIPCSCQGPSGAPEFDYTGSTLEHERCNSSLHLLTATNEVATPAGAQIWKFLPRATNNDARFWRLAGNVGVFELLQSLSSVPMFSSTAFHIEKQGCFIAYLARDTSGVLPEDAEWMHRGEVGSTLHVWKYRGGHTPDPCPVQSSAENAFACAFEHVQVVGEPSGHLVNPPNAAGSSYPLKSTTGHSAPHQMTRGAFPCSPKSLGCIVGARSVQHFMSTGEHYLAIAQSVCERGERQVSCDEKTLHGVLEVRSAVLQWDKDSQQMSEMLSMSDATAIMLQGKPVKRPFNGRRRDLHKFPLRSAVTSSVPFIPLLSSTLGTSERQRGRHI